MSVMQSPYRPQRIEPSGIQRVDLAVRGGNRIERAAVLAAGLLATIVVAGLAAFMISQALHSAVAPLVH